MIRSEVRGRDHSERLFGIQSLNDSELQSAVQNKEEVSVCESNVTDYNWIYEVYLEQADLFFI